MDASQFSGSRTVARERLVWGRTPSRGEPRWQRWVLALMAAVITMLLSWPATAFADAPIDALRATLGQGGQGNVACSSAQSVLVIP